MGVWNKVKKELSQFAFEVGIEENRPELITGLRTWIDKFSVEQWHSWINNMEMPPVPPEYFAQVTPYSEYLESFDLQDVIEFLAEARADLVEYLNSIDNGGEYIVKLKNFLMDSIKHPEKSLALSTDYVPKDNMARATCDKCGKSLPVPKGSPPIDKCPFCGAE